MIHSATKREPMYEPPTSRRSERDYSPIELLIRAYRREQLKPSEALMTHPGTTIEYGIMQFHGPAPKAPGKPTGGGLPELACIRQAPAIKHNTKLSRVGAAIRRLPKDWLAAVKAKYETADGEIRTDAHAMERCGLTKHRYRDYTIRAEMWIAGQAGVRATW